MLHIEGCYHQFRLEDAWEILFQPFKQALLSASRHDDALNSHALYGLQQFKSTLYGFYVGQGIEDVALYLIYIFFLLVGSLSSPLFAGKDVDGTFAGASLVHVHVLTRHYEVVLLHGTHPGLGMVLHAVEQNAVHVKQDGTHILSAQRRYIKKGRAFRPPFSVGYRF